MSSVRRVMKLAAALAILLAIGLLLVACQNGGTTSAATTTPVPLVQTEEPDTPAPPPAPSATPSPAPTATEAVSHTPTPSASGSEAIMALGTRTSLGLRMSPSGTAPVTHTVPGSEVLWVEGQSEDGAWLLVRYGEAGARGWAAAADLSVFGDVAQVPVAAADAAVRAGQPAAQDTDEASGYVLAGRLNVRQGPGTDQATIGQLVAGEQVTETGRNDGGDWLRIAWDDGEAWVAAQYIALGEAPAGAVAAAPGDRRQPAAGLAGQVAIQTRIGGDIYLVNADGSGLRSLVQGIDPALSPDARFLAYTRWGQPQEGVFVLDLQTGEERRVVEANRPRWPRWSPDAQRLVFAHVVRSYTCVETPFGCLDEEQVQMIFRGGDCISTPIGEICLSDYPVRHIDDTGLVQVTLADGAWLDLPTQVPAQSPDWHPRWDEIVYRGPDGLEVTAPAGETRPLTRDVQMRGPVWSPDGQQIVVQMRQHDHEDIFLLDAGGNVQRALTSPPPLAQRPVNNVAPTWSPDGRHILFLSDRDGSWRLYRMNADGTGQALFLPGVLDEVNINYEFAAERVVSWSRPVH